MCHLSAGVDRRFKAAVSCSNGIIFWRWCHRQALRQSGMEDSNVSKNGWHSGGKNKTGGCSGCKNMFRIDAFLGREITGKLAASCTALKVTDQHAYYVQKRLSELQFHSPKQWKLCSDVFYSSIQSNWSATYYAVEIVNLPVDPYIVQEQALNCIIIHNIRDSDVEWHTIIG